MSLFSNIVFLIFIYSLKTLYIVFCSYLPASSISSQIHPHCPSHPTLSLLLCNPSTPICGAHIFIDMWPSNGACSACQELHSKETDSPFPSSYRLPVASQLRGDFMPTSTEHDEIFFLSWSHSGLVHTVTIIMSSHVQLHCFFLFLLVYFCG